MDTPADLQELVLLMQSRHSARGCNQIPATEELAVELNTVVVPNVPSGGDFRTLSFTTSQSGSLLLVCRDMRVVTRKYGFFTMELLHQESGYICAFANLYLIKKGYSVRHIHTPEAFRMMSTVLAELLLFKFGPRGQIT